MTTSEKLVEEVRVELYAGRVPTDTMKSLLKLLRGCIENAEMKERETRREKTQALQNMRSHHVTLVRTCRSEGLTVPDIAKRTGLKPRRVQNIIFNHQIPLGPQP